MVLTATGIDKQEKRDSGLPTASESDYNLAALPILHCKAATARLPSDLSSLLAPFPPARPSLATFTNPLLR